MGLAVDERLGGEQRPYSPTELVLGDGGVDEHVGVEGVHGLTPGESGTNVADEGIGAFLAQRRPRPQPRGPTVLQRLVHAGGRRQRAPGPSRAQGVGSHEDRHRLPVPGQGDLLTSDHPLDDGGQ
jgi:hypothetical protein